MTENEWSKITSSNNISIAFYDYWTQKEAVLKAHGSGITIPLNSFENKNYATCINKRDFILKELKIDENYICYLAFNNNIDPNILSPFHIKSHELL